MTRTFATGATRDVETGKLDYEGFLSPRALTRLAEYMHKHRHLPDGSLRDSDNWQKGIPRDVYMKSLFRHFVDAWRQHRGLIGNETIEDALCGILFNTQGYLHELLKQREAADDAEILATIWQDIDETYRSVKERMERDLQKPLWHIDGSIPLGSVGNKTMPGDLIEVIPTTGPFAIGERVRSRATGVEGAIVSFSTHELIGVTWDDEPDQVFFYVPDSLERII